MNQIPAIINTSPPEPKAPAAEMSADMVVESIVPSNNYGKDQFEITAKIEAIDQFYSKKYWILQSMPGAKDLQPGQTQTVSLRRRRLQQTREGVVKKGYNDEGRMLNHEWDWEIVAFGATNNEVAVPTAPATNTIAPVTTNGSSNGMSTSDRIDRAVAVKLAVAKSDKSLREIDQEELGWINAVTDEFVKILNNEFGK
tara:strand:+ start:294 stop:887 length:594 start_codon:yes stop_codon:yes gene_type:complete